LNLPVSLAEKRGRHIRDEERSPMILEGRKGERRSALLMRNTPSSGRGKDQAPAFIEPEERRSWRTSGGKGSGTCCTSLEGEGPPKKGGSEENCDRLLDRGRKRRTASASTKREKEGNLERKEPMAYEGVRKEKGPGGPRPGQ